GDTTRRAPHVACGDVAPPAVVEAEEDEDHQLDPDDDQHRLRKQRVVIPRNALVEAELEGEPPGERDQSAISDDLPDSVAIDRNQADPGARRAEASRTTATTRS